MTSTRLIAAAVGLAVLLPAIVLGGELAVVVIVALAMAISLAEYAAMAFPEERVSAFAWLAVLTAAVSAAIWYGDGRSVAAAGALGVMGTMAQVTFRPGADLGLAAQRIGRFLLGAAWVSLLGFLVLVRRFEHGRPPGDPGPFEGFLDVGVVWVILTLAISWLSDTGAYFAGRAFGKHKLYPLVSPKKTWEGLFGGLATALAGVVLVRTLWLPELSWADVLVLGAVGSLVSVVGDLCESLLKRAFEVKDSGWIMPGHGGMLDRIDSVLFVAPTVWSWMVLVHGS